MFFFTCQCKFGPKSILLLRMIFGKEITESLLYCRIWSIKNFDENLLTHEMKSIGLMLTVEIDFYFTYKT